MYFPSEDRKQYFFFWEKVGKSMKNSDKGWIFDIKFW